MSRTRTVSAVGRIGRVVGRRLAQPAQAQTSLYWDPASSGTNTGGGTGTWSVSGNYWYNGSTDVNWTDTTGTATAVFGGTTAGTVTIGSGGVTAGGLTFNTAGYYITGTNLTLAGALPTITMNASGGTIASIVAGNAGFTVAGRGSWTLPARAPSPAT